MAALTRSPRLFHWHPIRLLGLYYFRYKRPIKVWFQSLPETVEDVFGLVLALDDTSPAHKNIYHSVSLCLIVPVG